MSRISLLLLCLAFLPQTSRASCEDSLSLSDLMRLVQNGQPLTLSTQTKLSNVEIQSLGASAQFGQITLRIENTRFSPLELLAFANNKFGFEVATAGTTLSYADIQQLRLYTADRPFEVIVNSSRFQSYELSSLLSQGVQLTLAQASSGLSISQIQAMTLTSRPGQISLLVTNNHMESYELIALRQANKLKLQLSLAGASNLDYAALYTLCKQDSEFPLGLIVDSDRLGFAGLNQIAKTGHAELWIDTARAGLSTAEMMMLNLFGQVHVLAR